MNELDKNYKLPSGKLFHFHESCDNDDTGYYYDIFDENSNLIDGGFLIYDFEKDGELTEQEVLEQLAEFAELSELLDESKIEIDEIIENISETNGIKIKDNTVSMSKEEWANEREINYLNFVLGYDLLQDTFKKGETPECDTNYDFCDYLSRKFIETDYYKNERYSTYEMLDRWIRDNKDLIHSEYLYSVGVEDKKILEVGDRNGSPIALVKWNKAGREEYLVAFEYKITDNKLHWGYGYYYDGNLDKAKEDFKKVRNGGNLAETFKKKSDREER